MIFIESLIFIFGILGSILLARGNKLGFLSFVLHSSIWGVVSFNAAQWWPVITCICFIIIDLFGYYTWTKRERGNKTNEN